MNSGSDVFKGLGILAHVGQTELQAGIGAGERFKAAGVKNAVCFNQEVGNQALTLRCNGFFTGLGLADPKAGKVLTGKISDPADMQAKMTAAFQADATIDGILTLGPSVAVPALKAVAAAGRPIHLATFDLNTDVLTAIKDGKMDFAIDQQQFLQGYLPIVILTNYAETGNLPTGDGTGLIMTGPGFVTKDNAANVIALAAKGLR
jgi:simple sugar transport system substrate-binding protein